MGIISDTLTNAYVKKHKSCGGCQDKWGWMQDNMGLKAPPNLLAQQAKKSKNAKKIMDTLYNAKSQAKSQNLKRRKI